MVKVFGAAFDIISTPKSQNKNGTPDAKRVASGAGSTLGLVNALSQAGGKTMNTATGNIHSTTIKGRNLLGLAVVGSSDGKQLGQVQDLFFDHDGEKLLALVLANKDLFGLIDAIIVPWHEVKQVGGDVIMVESSASAKRLGDEPRIRDLAQRETTLSGTQVLSPDGKQIGTLADMVIDLTDGHIIGYEISTGLIQDTLRGKKFLPAPPGLAIGNDAAIASPESAARLQK
jgi:uncharacterized protein YrrD